MRLSEMPFWIQPSQSCRRSLTRHKFRERYSSFDVRGPWRRRNDEVKWLQARRDDHQDSIVTAIRYLDKIVTSNPGFQFILTMSLTFVHGLRVGLKPAEDALHKFLVGLDSLAYLFIRIRHGHAWPLRAIARLPHLPVLSINMHVGDKNMKFLANLFAAFAERDGVSSIGVSKSTRERKFMMNDQNKLMQLLDKKHLRLDENENTISKLY